MGRWAIGGVAVMLVVGTVACSDGPEPVHEPTPRAISADCRQAFEEAAAASSHGEVPGDEEGTTYGGSFETEGSFLDLLPTLDACRNSEEWFEAYRASPSEATAALPPSLALRSLCERTDTSGGPCEGVAPPRDRHPAP